MGLKFLEMNWLLYYTTSEWADYNKPWFLNPSLCNFLDSSSARVSLLFKHCTLEKSVPRIFLLVFGSALQQRSFFLISVVQTAWVACFPGFMSVIINFIITSYQTHFSFSLPWSYSQQFCCPPIENFRSYDSGTISGCSLLALQGHLVSCCYLVIFVPVVAFHGQIWFRGHVHWSSMSVKMVEHICKLLRPPYLIASLAAASLLIGLACVIVA